jgi:PAS domain S-box-containing protein
MQMTETGSHMARILHRDTYRTTSEDLHQRSLQALQAHIAVVDRQGRIIFINKAWENFAASNGGTTEPWLAIGTNYLDVCRKAAAAEDHAAQALAGVEAVLAGTLPQFSLEYPCHSPGEQRWFLMTVAPLDQDGATGAVISHLDVSVIKLAEQALRAGEMRFRAIFENAAVGIAEIAPDGCWLRMNERFERITGYQARDLAATTYLGITHPDEIDADVAQMEVMRAGAINSYSLEKRLKRPDETFVWLNATLSCVRDADGGIAYFIALFEDISERKTAEERQRTLLEELSHRGKNLLAVIRSIASRSLAGPGSLAEAKEAFDGRLQALAQTYGVLTNEAFDGVLVDAVLHQELSLFGGRARLEGPSVILTVKASQTFALVAHELATNAAKYGALSALAGRLHVTWEVVGSPDDRQLVFDWREEGGPPASPPTRRGFGTTLVSAVAGAEFGCVPELIYGPEGFRYRFTAPLARLGAVLRESPVRRRLRSAVACSLYDTWARQHGAGGALPKLAGFDWARFAATGALTIAAVEEGGSVRFVQVGRALLGELGRPLEDQDMPADDMSRTLEVYRGCALAARPTHELLDFNFGDDDPLTFERLLVPFAATANGTVTHVVGIAIYDGHTRPVASGDS